MGGTSMNFVFKQKPVNVDLFTSNPEAFEFGKVDYARKFIPEWWKSLPVIGGDDLLKKRNMRYCAGFNDLYQKGFIVPAWSDTHIEVGAIGVDYGTYQYSDQTSKAEFHAQDQRGAFANYLEYMHLKLIPPWHVRCKEAVQFSAFGAQYNQEELRDYVVALGLLDFKYQHSINVNMFFPKEKEAKKILIKHGTPLMHVTPLSERDLKIHRHLVSESELSLMVKHNNPITFQASYYKVKQLLGPKKCPF
jgi:hypothetical protein